MSSIGALLESPKFLELVHTFAIRFPRVYLSLVCAYALLGYLFLAAFPILVLILTIDFPVHTVAASTLYDWSMLLIQLVVIVLSCVITFQIGRTHIPIPQGLELKWNQSPVLLEMIADLRNDYECSALHRIIILPEYRLDIVQTPRFGIPLWTTNTLIIGLPVMQCLSALHVKGLLARKIGQMSGIHNRLTGWLFCTRKIWMLYRDVYAVSKLLGIQPLKYFFFIYEPFLRAISFSAARKDELEADRYAMDIMDDDDLAKMFSSEIVSRTFLEKKFWPKIYSLTRKNPDAPLYTPHANMIHVLQKGLVDKEVRLWLEEAYNTKNFKDPMPPLAERMEAIGGTGIVYPNKIEETAAQHFFKGRLKSIIQLMDDEWFKMISNATQGKARLGYGKELRSHIPKGKTLDPALSSNELWKCAKLIEKKEGKLNAIPIYKKVLEVDAQHVKTLYAIGRILLSCNDAAGIRALEKAMALDNSCTPSACKLIAKFFSNKGEKIAANTYMKKALSSRTSSAA